MKIETILAVIAIIVSLIGVGFVYVSTSSLQNDINDLQDAINIIAPVGAKTLIDAQREGKVVIYTGMPLSVVEAIKAGVEAKYPFITVEYVTGDSYSIYERYRTEHSAGNVLADIVAFAAPELYVGEMKDNDMMLKYDTPYYTKYPDYAKDPGYWFTYRLSVHFPFYNTELVQPGEITSWWDLTDPKYDGKIVFHTPLGTAAIRIFFGLKEKLGIEFWNALADNHVFVGTSTETYEKVISGEYPIGIGAIGERMLTYKDQGAPIEVIIPDEGLTFFTCPAAIAKQAPHPNAAKLVLDYMMSDEGQQYGVEKAHFYSPLGYSPSGIPAFDDLSVITFDEEAFAEQRPALEEEFKELFGVS